MNERLSETILWTALVTPFSPDGARVDFKAAEVLLRRQEAAGNGVLLLGSTGESMALSEAEKREVVQMATALNLSVPLMVGVPNINRAQTLDWIAFCNGQGVDAFLASTPAYTKPAAQGQIGWFGDIMNAAACPVMLYNIPSRTGAVLSPQVLSALGGHQNFWAVKESSGGLDAYIDYRAAAPHVAIYSGDDNMMPAVAPFGACGLVSVASNVWPEECRAYVDSCLGGGYFGTDWWRISKA
jgi:4-hydroxy-tetrahydrodipicolinate synthase